MRLLDLYCAAGGAGMGYYRAGFEVVGVDIEPQPRYPFEFHQADALEYLALHGMDFDVIHASPPCQAHSVLKSLSCRSYVDLISDTRNALREIDRPYIIENVVGAPLIMPVLLCGTMFGLKVYRHRLFEVSVLMLAPHHVPHRDKTPAVGRGISPKGFISVTGTGGFGIPRGLEYAQTAMGINWMTRREMSQAIPPAYTQWLGRRLLEML